MMAHEVPIQVHQKVSAGAKTRKHKPMPQPKNSSQNEKSSSSTKSRDKQLKGKEPSLPNGDRPDFGSSDHKREYNGKAGSPKNTKNGNSKKIPTSSEASGVSSGSTTELTDTERYAGSSFHSSPEALALPKPSFAGGSPSSKPNELVSHPVIAQNQPVRPDPYHMAPTFVYQGMPSNGPPRYPVTAYPSSSHSGYNNIVPQQGFMNYNYNPIGIHQPRLPIQSYPYQYMPSFSPPPPAPSQMQLNHNGGQKISFSDLMGSSKQ